MSLYENIHKKRARIKAGSGEKMRGKNDPKRPTAKDFKNASKTAKNTTKKKTKRTTKKRG